MDAVSLSVQMWLGSMFVYSAALKLAAYSQARRAVAAHQVLPPRAATVFGVALPWLEATAGSLLLLGVVHPGPPLTRLGSALGAVLGATFAYGTAHVLVHEREVPCGCTGNDFVSVSKVTLARAGCVLGASVFLLASPIGRSDLVPWAVVVAVAAAAAAPAALVAGRDLVRRLRRRQVERLHARADLQLH